MASGLYERISLTLNELASCLCKDIRRGEFPEPCFCGVFPGSAAPLDYCTDGCEGGQAWVRLGGVGTPEDQLEVRSCTGMLAIQIEMGWVAGFVTSQPDGQPLDMAAQLAGTDRQLQQMDLMYRVLTCCNTTMGEQISGLAYTPIGPEGTCLGGIWTGIMPIV